MSGLPSPRANLTLTVLWYRFYLLEKRTERLTGTEGRGCTKGGAPNITWEVLLLLLNKQPGKQASIISWRPQVNAWSKERGWAVWFYLDVSKEEKQRRHRSWVTLTKHSDVHRSVTSDSKRERSQKQKQRRRNLQRAENYVINENSAN